MRIDSEIIRFGRAAHQLDSAGSGDGIAVFSLAPGAEEIALHELGHSAFGLADEYDCFVCDGLETDRNNHPPRAGSASPRTTATTCLRW